MAHCGVQFCACSQRLAFNNSHDRFHGSRKTIVRDSPVISVSLPLSVSLSHYLLVSLTLCLSLFSPSLSVCLCLSLRLSFSVLLCPFLCPDSSCLAVFCVFFLRALLVCFCFCFFLSVIFIVCARRSPRVRRLGHKFQVWVFWYPVNTPLTRASQTMLVCSWSCRAEAKGSELLRIDLHFTQVL